MKNKVGTVEEFIVSIRGEYKFELTADTQLEFDLKITGDDADEFIEEFSKSFNVDIESFDFSKYFAPEGSFALNMLVVFGKATGKKSLTIGDLAKAISSGILR